MNPLESTTSTSRLLLEPKCTLVTSTTPSTLSSRLSTSSSRSLPSDSTPSASPSSRPRSPSPRSSKEKEPLASYASRDASPPTDKKENPPLPAPTGLPPVRESETNANASPETKPLRSLTEP